MAVAEEKKNAWSGTLTEFAPEPISSAVVAIICFFVVNATACIAVSDSGEKPDSDKAIQETLRTTGNRTFSWWTSKGYHDEPRAPDVVLIGSSQMGSATFAADAQMLNTKVDVLKHRHNTTMERALDNALEKLGAENSHFSVYNCSQGGFMVSDAYMMSKALFSGRRKPKVAVIGISPRDFMDNSVTAASATEPFQFYARCVNPGPMASFSFADPLSRLQWFLSKDLPLRKLNFLANAKTSDHAQEDEQAAQHHGQGQLVQALSDISGDLKPGTLIIPANIPRTLTDNSNEYEHRYQNPYPPVYANERVYFKELLSFLNSAGIKVIVVGMPTLWTTREILPTGFWTDFRQFVGQTCREQNIPFIDYMDANDFDANDFLDTVHLNAYGGTKLFSMISQQLAENAQMASRLLGTGDIKALAGRRSAGTQ